MPGLVFQDDSQEFDAALSAFIAALGRLAGGADERHDGRRRRRKRTRHGRAGERRRTRRHRLIRHGHSTAIDRARSSRETARGSAAAIQSALASLAIASGFELPDNDSYDVD
jgi:hypothetical protein